MDIYVAYFDRRADGIDGLFTLHKNGEPVFKHLKMRSGQRGHTETSWVRAKSPIPYGSYYLWLDKPQAVGVKAKGKVIGEFFQISNQLNNRRLIRNLFKPEQIREDIGLHGENEWPGSAGCIVLVDQVLAYETVFPYLREIGKTQDHIKLVVT